MRPLPIPHLHDWRKMEACLINFNKGKDDEGCLKFCNIWNGVQLCKENYWSVLKKVLHTWVGGPLNFEALCFSLSSLYVNPALVGHHYTQANTNCRLIKLNMHLPIHDLYSLYTSLVFYIHVHRRKFYIRIVNIYILSIFIY